jgi:hypothetical protein
MDRTDDENNKLSGNSPESVPAASPQIESDAPVDTETDTETAHAGPSPHVPDEYLDVLDASDPTPASLFSFTFDSKRHHDQARSKIAFWLLALLTGLLFATAVGFAGLFFVKESHPTFDQFKSLVELILTPLLTLVSAATGFYFGSQKQEG